MADNPHKKANSFLETGNDELTFILKKVNAIAAINQCVSTHIDPHLRDYCRVANLNAGQLTLVAANSSIATQIRFQSVNLLSAFKQDRSLRHIKEIRCIVRQTQPTTSAPTKQANNMPPLSAETAELIRDTAQSIDDEKLRKVMERIATRTR